MVTGTTGNFSALHHFKIVFLSSVLHALSCSEYTLTACCKLWHRFRLQNYCFTYSCQFHQQSPVKMLTRARNLSFVFSYKAETRKNVHFLKKLIINEKYIVTSPSLCLSVQRKSPRSSPYESVSLLTGTQSQNVILSQISLFIVIFKI